MKLNMLVVSTIVSTFFTLSAHAVLAADLSHRDKSFLKDAAEAGYTEIEASKLALSKSINPQIKEFAEKIVKDHEAVGTELAALAQAKQVKLPTSPGILQKSKIKLLSLKDGTNFDEKYTEEIGIEAHQDAVKLFEKASKASTDVEVKQFAQKHLPDLQHHLEMAKTLKPTVNH